MEKIDKDLNREINGYISECYSDDAKYYYHIFEINKKEEGSIYYYRNIVNLIFSIECILKSIYFNVNLEEEYNKNYKNLRKKSHNLSELLRILIENKNNKIYDKLKGIIEEEDDSIKFILEITGFNFDGIFIFGEGNKIKKDFTKVFDFISKVGVNIRYKLDIIKHIPGNELLLLGENIKFLDEFYGKLSIISHDICFENNFKFRGNIKLKHTIENYLSENLKK